MTCVWHDRLPLHLQESEDKFSQLIEEKRSVEKKWAESEEKLAGLEAEVGMT